MMPGNARVAAPAAVVPAAGDAQLAREWAQDAQASLRRGELAAATGALERAVRVLRIGDEDAALAVALATASEAYAEAGQLGEALRCGIESLTAAHDCGDGHSLAVALLALGRLHGQLGQLDESARLLGQAMRTAETLDDSAVKAAILAALCACTTLVAERSHGSTSAERRIDLADDAVEHGRRGLEAARRAKSAYAEASCGASLAAALLRKGELAATRQCLTDAGALADAHGFQLLRYRIGTLDGQTLMACGDVAGAIARLASVAAASEKAGAAAIEIEARAALYRAAKAVDRYDTALAAHERMHELDLRIRSEAAQTRARVLINEVETHNARLEAEKARLEAELLRLKSRRLESEKRALEAQARELDRHANQDALTGLWNRRHIDEELPRILAEARERNAPLTVATADIDFFKAINDRYGHPTGDVVLCAVADLLRDNCRPSDTVARVGGEEFLLVLEDSDAKGAWLVCERLRRALERHAWTDVAPELAVTVSFGIAEALADTDTRGLLAAVDEQLYAAKRAGRNRVEPSLR
jgi:diguanylate cyclase (GGDEF)-like protein